MSRRGFSLLEVILALAILTMSLVVLVEMQATAVVMTQEAERATVASDLARLKMSEAMLRLETEGFQTTEVIEYGDFDDFGDEISNIQFGKELKDYHWEYTITEIDIELAGDLASMVGEMDGGMGEMLGGGGGGSPMGGDGAGPGNPAGMLAGMLSPDMLTQMIGPYIRMVTVRVWWGKDSETAQRDGTEVTLATHVANPAGMLAVAPPVQP